MSISKIFHTVTDKQLGSEEDTERIDLVDNCLCFRCISVRSLLKMSDVNTNVLLVGLSVECIHLINSLHIKIAHYFRAIHY